MPVTVERQPDLPVIVATIIGDFHPEDVLTIYDRTADLRQTMPEYIYRVTDVRKAKTTFSEIIRAIKTAAQQRNSATVDPTVRVIFVGHTQWGRLFTDALRQGQFGGVDIPIFSTLEDALDYIRQDIERKDAAS